MGCMILQHDDDDEHGLQGLGWVGWTCVCVCACERLANTYTRPIICGAEQCAD
jgi:hypothetical protein